MEWQLTEERKSQYTGMLRNAQDIEITIGSTEYRKAKLIAMREGIDKNLKEWWDTILKEMALDPAKDYMITQDGCVKEVARPSVAAEATPSVEAVSKVGMNATELK